MISVIVPYFNAEATIDKCVASILKQDYKDFEIIVVNDGSTLNLAPIDKRIKIINIAHQGVSEARNVGMDNAKGEFIFFLDADDVLTENAFDSLLESSADLIVSGYSSSDVRYYLQAPNKNTQFAFVWGKLFRAEIIKHNGIRFKKMDKHEDTEFVFNYLFYTKTISWLKQRTVIHCQPETGKGMQVFDASRERQILFMTIGRLPNTDAGLIANCESILKKVDLVRSCRQGNILRQIKEHGLKALVYRYRARKRYTPLVILGSGSTARLLFDECRKRKIRVECFCDEVNKLSFCDLRVLNPQELKALFPNARIMITTSDLRNVVRKLKGMGFRHFLYNKTVRLLRAIQAVGYDKFCLDNCIDANRNHNNTFWVRSLDVMITERCSLKCKDCSNLMQYYTHPVDCDIGQVYESLTALLEYVTIGEIRIIGGEPFLHHGWQDLLFLLISHPKVKRIVIYTNGTRIVSTRYLTNPKVFVLITDYGKLSISLEHLEHSFDMSGVNYKIQQPEWSDCGKIYPHERGFSGMQRTFSECCSKNITLSDDKLYLCAFAANLARLDKFDADYHEVRDSLGFKRFVNQTYIMACDLCNGRPFNPEKIIPAVQTRRGNE